MVSIIFLPQDEESVARAMQYKALGGDDTEEAEYCQVLRMLDLLSTRARGIERTR